MTIKNGNAYRLLIKVPFLAYCAGLAFFSGINIQAAPLYFDNAKMSGAVDSTMSYGATVRSVSGTDEALADANVNDGNTHFTTSGLSSSTFKFTTEVELRYDNLGFFSRASGFYDRVIMDDGFDTSSDTSTGLYRQFNADGTINSDFDASGNEYPDEVKDRAGNEIRLLDAFVFGDFEVAKLPVTMRLGQQLVSWGEGLTMQNGINASNPANLAALRIPGAEIKEALLPLPMVYGQVGISNSLSAESFYMLTWEPSILDASGSYFSTADSIGDGGTETAVDYLGADVLAPGTEDLVFQYNGNSLIDADDLARINNKTLYMGRTSDDDAKDSGQFGFALRYYSEKLNNTDFGLFYMNYHSHTPAFGVTLGNAGGGAASTNYAQTLSTITSGSVTATASPIATNLNGLYTGGVTSATIEADGPGFGLSATDIATTKAFMQGIEGVCAATPALACYTGVSQNVVEAGIQPAVQAQVAASIDAGMNSFNLVENSQYFLAFPENVHMVGVSFNTSIGDTSVGGEVAYRPNAPISIMDNVDFITALVGASATIGSGGVGNFGAAWTEHSDGTSIVGGSTLLNSFRTKSVDMNLTAMQNLPVFLGLDSLLGIAEVGLTHYPDLLDFAYDGLDETSYGYRLILAGTFNDVLAGINVTPAINFGHDLHGDSALDGNFSEGTKDASISLGANYKGNMAFALSYNTYWNGEDNKLEDRDNASLNFKYSF